jgi:CheY-like chemotaxis protein
MDVLIVEDDDRQAADMSAALRRSFPEINVHRIGDESAFRRALPDLRDAPPDAVIMDIMLRWAAPQPEMPEVPEEVREGGFYRAGLRCLDLLLQSPQTSRVPVVLYSVIERADVAAELKRTGGHVLFLRKDSDPEALVRHLRALQVALGEAPADPPWGSSLWQSLEAKPGWLGFSIDLKEVTPSPCFLYRPSPKPCARSRARSMAARRGESAPVGLSTVGRWRCWRRRRRSARRCA